MSNRFRTGPRPIMFVSICQGAADAMYAELRAMYDVLQDVAKLDEKELEELNAKIDRHRELYMTGEKK